MRFRSRKMEAIYRKRRPLVERMLAENPMCQRCMIRPSTDVHEIKSRARGGSILNESNCVALCRTCHDWITENPARAKQEGWLKNSWETE